MKQLIYTNARGNESRKDVKIDFESTLMFGGREVPVYSVAEIKTGKRYLVNADGSVDCHTKATAATQWLPGHRQIGKNGRVI